MLAAALISVLVGAGIIFGTLFLVRKQLATAGSGEADTILPQIAETTKAIFELANQKEGYASKGQFDTLIREVTKISDALAGEKAKLTEIEKKLRDCQGGVEAKEAQQQDIKSTRDEEHEKLQALLENYEKISANAIALEQQLAASLKSLDRMLTELELTQDQRTKLEELSATLSDAGAVLRDLIMEYETVFNRLSQLKLQHKDLEEEYTRLVEQQLGE